MCDYVRGTIRSPKAVMSVFLSRGITSLEVGIMESDEVLLLAGPQFPHLPGQDCKSSHVHPALKTCCLISETQRPGIWL